MRWILALLLVPALMAPAAAASGLEDMLDTAKACTDAAMRERATQSCDAPSQLATIAVNACRSKWDALAARAVVPPPTGDGEAHARALKAYAEGMAYEYSKIAELKAIELRAASDAGDCSAQ